MVSAKEKNLSVLIKKKAHELGFDLCGIAQARILDRKWGSTEKMVRSRDERRNVLA